MPSQQNRAATINGVSVSELGDLLSDLENVVRQTFRLWDEVRVGFSWRNYYINHTVRVRNLAVRLAESEGADARLCALAATLHDITKRYDGEIITDHNGKRIVDENGFWKCRPNAPARGNETTRVYNALNLYGQMHHVSGAAVARELLLARGVDERTTAAVGDIIRAHVRGNGNGDDGHSERPECRLLYDADLMDANLGLVAFIRNIGIHVHRRFEQTGRLDLDEYLDYLPSWIEMKHDFVGKLLTESGRKIGEARRRRKMQLAQWVLDERKHRDESRQLGLLGIIEYFMSHHEDPDLERQMQGLKDEWLPGRAATLLSLGPDRGGRVRFERASEFIRLLSAEVAGMA